MTELPRQGRLAGVDYGTVRIGIAICDPSQSVASPLECYQRGPDAEAQRHFQRLVVENDLVGFVVGLPVWSDGGESQKSREARAFADWLRQTTRLPVALYDERYSTSQAESMLMDQQLTSKQRKQRIDMLAAQIILSGYLESSREGTEQPEGLE